MSKRRDEISVPVGSASILGCFSHGTLGTSEAAWFDTPLRGRSLKQGFKLQTRGVNHMPAKSLNLIFKLRKSLRPSSASSFLSFWWHSYQLTWEAEIIRRTSATKILAECRPLYFACSLQRLCWEGVFHVHQLHVFALVGPPYPTLELRKQLPPSN